MELNWPATGLILGFTAMVVFRKPLTDLLGRTEKIKDWISAPKQTALLPSDVVQSVASDTDKTEVLAKSFDSELLLLQEAAIVDDLKGHGLTVGSQCERILVRHLAGAQIALHLERVHAKIYASQVAAVRWLSTQKAPVDASALKTFYDRATHNFPWLYDKYTYQNWLRFLAQERLIIESEESRLAGRDADPSGIQITVLGRDYLLYLARTGIAEPTLG